jgi:hypothetical protein
MRCLSQLRSSVPCPLSPVPCPLSPGPGVSSTWWPQRGWPTRSHSELGRETPQRRWYYATRRGRVGRRQVDRTPAAPAPGDRGQGTDDRRQKRTGLAARPPRPQHHNPSHAPAHPTETLLLSSVVCPLNAGWSSPVARQAHNLKVVGSNPTPATNSARDPKGLQPSGNTRRRDPVRG